MTIIEKTVVACSPRRSLPPLRLGKAPLSPRRSLRRSLGRRDDGWRSLGLVVLLGACVPVFAAETGPWAYWKCDEGQGDIVADASGHGFNGKLQGGEWVKNGKIGGALFLKGKDKVVFGNVLNPEMDSFTVMAWVKQDTPTTWNGQPYPNSITATGFVFNKLTHNGKNYEGYGIGEMGVSFGDDSASIPNGYRSLGPGLPLGRWVHVAVVFDRGTGVIRCYHDGAQVGSVDTTMVTGSIENKVDFVLGYCAFGGANYFTKALIDEIVVYRRALTANELKKDGYGCLPTAGGR